MKTSVDNLCIYDAELQFMADRFVDEIGTNSAVHAVRTMDDLRAALNNYLGVKFLEICLHGSPGMVYLNDKTAVAGTYLNKMAATNPNLVQKNARILFDSCSIGACLTGDTFMNSIGAGILKDKGGIVGASTVDNMVFPLFSWTGAYLAPGTDGRLKIRKYDASGKLTGSVTVDRHGAER